MSGGFYETTVNVSSEQRRFEGVDEDIHLVTLVPPVGVRAVMLFVHGHGEFASRYVELFSPLVDGLGIKVMIPDLPGHGISTGKRGHVRHLDQIARLFSCLADEARGDAALPLFLAGHSMGGLIAAWLTLRHEIQPDAVWMASPLLVPGKAKSPLILAAAKILDKIAPTLVIHNGVKESDCYEMGETSEPAADSDADKWQPVEVVHRWISMRLGMELVRAEKRVWSESVELWPGDTPLLLTQGGRDPVCPPENAREFARGLEKAGMIVRYHEFPDALHEPHRDGHADELSRAVADWLVGQMPPAR